MMCRKRVTSGATYNGHTLRPVIKVLSIGFAVAGVITAFVWPVWAWTFLAIPELFLSWMWFMHTWQRYKETYREMPGLSPSASALFTRYRHYYYMPTANTDFAGAANWLIAGSVAILAVELLKSFWWSLAIAIANAFLLANLAAHFDPHVALRGNQIAAHNEIVDRLAQQRRS
jgi:hypothetical protein